MRIYPPPPQPRPSFLILSHPPPICLVYSLMLFLLSHSSSSFFLCPPFTNLYSIFTYTYAQFLVFPTIHILLLFPFPNYIPISSIPYPFHSNCLFTHFLSRLLFIILFLFIQFHNFITLSINATPPNTLGLHPLVSPSTVSLHFWQTKNYIPVCLSLTLSLYFYLSVYLSVCLSVRLSAYLSICRTVLSIRF